MTDVRVTEEEEHQIIRARGLEEKNYWQASKIMELEMRVKAALRALEIYHQRDKKMTIEEVEEKKGEVLPFQQPKLAIVTGGKDGDGNDWFSNLEEGAVFISRLRQEKSPIAEQWHISIKWEKSTVLYSNFPHRGEVHILVSNRMFAEQNELIEILQERKEEILDD